MSNLTPQKSKFDPTALVAQGLGYLKHLRLMVIMLALGLLAGLIYYIYGTPLYEARSMVYVRSFANPTTTKIQQSEGLPSSTRVLQKAILYSLSSQSMQLRAAKRMGLCGQNADFGAVRAVIPKVRVYTVDAVHVEVLVFATEKWVVRNFAKELILAYREYQEELWSDYRTHALEVYAEDIAELRSKVDKGRGTLYEFERDSKMTELTLEQQNLIQIPREIVVSRERLQRMDAVRMQLKRFRSTRDASQPASIEQVLQELSLLSAFEKEEVVEVGDVVRQESLRGDSFNGKTEGAVASPPTHIVVQPAMVEGVDSWRDLELKRRLLKEEIGQVSGKFLANHSVMRRLHDELDDVEQGLRAELDVLLRGYELDYLRLTNKLAALQERLPEYHKIAEQFGKSTYRYDLMQKEQEIWENAEQELGEKLSLVTFAKGRDWVELTFLEHTRLRDDVPVSPNKMKLVMMALMLGGAGAIGLPTVLNLLNTHISSLDQLEPVIGLKGLGIVPLTATKVLEDVYRSAAQEGNVPNYLLENFRLIRANICLHPGRNNRSQCVMVTSARPQEGKTTLAANLAWAFHSMGEKTILIDCDLRRGRVHTFTGADLNPGLTRLLLDDVTLEETVQKSPNPLLDLIPRGKVIIGTTELLCQDGFDELIKKLRKSYARIVIDAPPVLGLSETSTLQRVSDGVVLVARSESTGRKDIQDAVNLLGRSGAHFFGFVLNAVDLSKVNNYYNYYYYSAGYYDHFEADEDDTNSASNQKSSNA